MAKPFSIKPFSTKPFGECQCADPIVPTDPVIPLQRHITTMSATVGQYLALSTRAEYPGDFVWKWKWNPSTTSSNKAFGSQHQTLSWDLTGHLVYRFLSWHALGKKAITGGIHAMEVSRTGTTISTKIDGELVGTAEITGTMMIDYFGRHGNEYLDAAMFDIDLSGAGGPSIVIPWDSDGSLEYEINTADGSQVTRMNLPPDSTKLYTRQGVTWVADDGSVIGAISSGPGPGPGPDPDPDPDPTPDPTPDPNDVPPTVVYKYPHNGQFYLFNAAGTTGHNGNRVKYHWDYGDGTESTRAIASKRYTEDGLRTVTLTVTDEVTYAKTVETFTHTVTERPEGKSVPYLTIAERTHSTATLAWRCDDFPQTGFSLQHRDASMSPHKYGPWVTVPGTGSLATEHVVTGLPEDKWREFRVRITHATGQTEFSRITLGSTLNNDPTRTLNITGLTFPTEINPALSTLSGHTAWANDPIRWRAPARPDISVNPVANYFYVNNLDPNATDNQNPNGTLAKPRLTVPDLRNMVAGTTVEIGGGHKAAYFLDHKTHGSRGTALAPITIRGTDIRDKPIVYGQGISFGDTEHLFFENLRIGGGNIGNNFVGFQHHILSKSQYVVMRGVELVGLEWVSGGAAMIGMSSDDRGPADVSDIFLYNLVSYDNDNYIPWDAHGFDPDHHILSVGSRTGPVNNQTSSRIYVMDCDLTQVSGNGLQITSIGLDIPNEGTPEARDWRDIVKHIYVGRVRAGMSRQAGLGSKRAGHVLFTECDVTEGSNLAGGNGQIFGFQYGADHLWFVNCRIRDGVFGLQQTDTGDKGTNGKLFILGNIITDIRNQITGPNANGEGAWRRGTAISFSAHGNMERYIFNNTIYDATNALAMGGSGDTHVKNNVMVVRNHTDPANVPASNATIVTLEGNVLNPNAPGYFSVWMDNNFAHDTTKPPAYSWGSKAVIGYLDKATFEGMHAQIKGFVEGDPGFTDAIGGDFTPAANSPLIGATAGKRLADNGVDPWTYFNDVYGRHLDKDAYGNPRIFGSDMDAGAVERQAA